MTGRDQQEQQPTNETHIDSDGGTVIQGDVNTEGDVAGRDINITHNYYAEQNPTKNVRWPSIEKCWVSGIPIPHNPSTTWRF